MKIQVFNSIQQIEPGDWASLKLAEFPFMSYHFLSALETTDCLGKRTGWSPVYLTGWDGPILQGAHVCFVKTNSYGEYIFDFNWAQASESLGVPYYPKLVSAVPFTPATGPKLLLNTKLEPSAENDVSHSLLAAVAELAKKLGTSSTHALFITPEEIPRFEASGYFIRHSYQYHWRNHNYSSFESFLTTLRGKRRREIVRERSQVRASNVTIERLTGASLRPEHADLFFDFYSDTVAKRGGYQYLTPEFFREVFQTMKEQILFVLAHNAEGLPVAGALYYIGAKALYGRHWGCLEDYKALHFELCYYQGIEFAIDRKLELFEAGAQGEHKFQRGFLPSLTYSAHSIAHPRMSGLVKEFVEHEKVEIAKLFTEYGEHSPFLAQAKSAEL